jgi:hypothetical protein
MNHEGAGMRQTRAVLDRYAERGGAYREAVFEASGHSPHLEEPEPFVRGAAGAPGRRLNRTNDTVS